MIFSRQSGNIFLREISIDVGIDRRPEVASARLSIALTSELQSRRKRADGQRVLREGNPCFGRPHRIWKRDECSPADNRSQNPGSCGSTGRIALARNIIGIEAGVAQW
jgi:hypothetical protein